MCVLSVLLALVLDGAVLKIISKGEHIYFLGALVKIKTDTKLILGVVVSEEAISLEIDIYVSQ